MFLLFDLGEHQKLRLCLFDNTGQQQEHIYEQRNTELLASVELFLKEHQLSKEDIRGIAVVVGAGSFSSTRVAATVANAWAYAKQIPVIAVQRADSDNYEKMIKALEDQEVGVYISATYSAEPDIGPRKKLS